MARCDSKVDVWLGKGNIAEFVVYADSTAITDLSGVSRGIICIGGTELDSDDDATLLWWDESVTDKTLSNGETYTGDVLRARIGKTSGLLAGIYPSSRISLYGSIGGAAYNTTTGALVVSDSIQFTVISACAS